MPNSIEHLQLFLIRVALGDMQGDLERGWHRELKYDMTMSFIFRPKETKTKLASWNRPRNIELIVDCRSGDTHVVLLSGLATLVDCYVSKTNTDEFVSSLNHVCESFKRECEMQRERM